MSLGIAILWAAACLAGLACIVGVGWLLHRFCIKLEEAGYLYYRNSEGGGGSGGVLYELDKLTRPSIEHVVEAQDTVKEEEEISGD